MLFLEYYRINFFDQYSPSFQYYVFPNFLFIMLDT